MKSLVEMQYSLGIMFIKPYSKCGEHKVRTRVGMCRDLRMTIVGAGNAWPLGPRVVTAARGRGLREQFKVHHGLSTMTHGSADAIIARVAAPMTMTSLPRTLM
jgi:hypothetical protein